MSEKLTVLVCLVSLIGLALWLTPSDEPHEETHTEVEHQEPATGHEKVASSGHGGGEPWSRKVEEASSDGADSIDSFELAEG